MNWISNTFRRRKLYDDLSEEMRLHIEEHVEHLIAEGLSTHEAQRQARIAFGNFTTIEDRSREVWQWPTAESIRDDIRFALRQLRKSPGFTVAAIVTLAMAVGANAVVFGVFNGLILRPLDVPNPQNLYSIERTGSQDTSQSYPDYLDIRERNRSFEDIAAYTPPQVALDTGHGPVATWGLETTGNYFDVLGIRPYFGRFFHAADEQGPNSAPFIVLSYAYWHSQFQDDRSILGRIVLVNKHPFTVVGVAPPAFRGTLVFYSPNFFVPLANQEQVEGSNDLNDRGSHGLLQVLGHLKPGVARAQAVDDLNSVGAWLGKTYPRNEPAAGFDLGRPSLLGNEISRPIKAFVAGLMLLATLILLAACVNLGGLFASRVADRSRELALRLALGSKRARILRSLFTEALLISLLGGAAGVGVGVAVLRWMSNWQPFGNFPMHTPVTPDGRVYCAALLVTLLSACLFGVAPAGQVFGASPYEVVKAGSGGRTPKRVAVRDVLLAVQISLCAVLVTSSLVAVRGLIRSLHGSFGFDPKDSMLVDLRMAGLNGAQGTAAQKRMLDAVKAIPGVDSAALTDALLLSDTNATNVFTDTTTAFSASQVAVTPYTFRISPAYLQAEGTALVMGRNFTSDDNQDAPRVAIVNGEFARKLFGSEIASIGRHFKVSDGKLVEVVGIAEDGKYGSLGEDPHPAVFFPLAQWPAGVQWMVIRSSRGPQQLGAEIRRALQQVDPGVPVGVEKRSDELVTVLFGPEMATIALGILGGIGIVLSITGIFGMAAYSVSKRFKELGIRVALGAQRRDLLRAALGRAIKILAIGSTAGLGLGILATRVLALIVYQATPRDPLVLAGAFVAMALLGIVATWIPAQRALSVDPLILLREE